MQWTDSIRGRLTLWYLGILSVVLMVYLVVVFLLQYGLLRSQIYHDEIQDVETAEGLLFFDPKGALQLRQDYYSHPQSHLLVDRLMEARDGAGAVLYRSETLHGMVLGGASQRPDEGRDDFNERTVRLEDGTWVLMISHQHPVEGRMLTIRLGYSLSPLARRMELYLGALLLGLPMALVGAGLAGYGITRRALAPLEAMAARAEQITASNLSGRVRIRNERDEVGRMGRVMNSLLGRLESSFAQLQRFTADAAHELKTPLTSIRAVGEGALEVEGAEREAFYREAISSMLEETGRLNQTVEGLLLISRAEAGQMALTIVPFLLRELVEEVLSLLEVVLEEREVRVQEEDLDRALSTVAADRMLLRTCIVNVLHNAVKFSPVGGTIRVGYEHVEAEGQTYLRLSIADEGLGIAPEDRERVFERFFRVRDVRKSGTEGSGLGLAIARLAMDANHGRIYFASGGKQGAMCQIEIPAPPFAREHPLYSAGSAAV